MANRVDLRDLMRRVARLQAVADAAVALRDSSYQQIDLAGLAMYWHVPDSAMARMVAACNDAYVAGDTDRREAGLVQATPVARPDQGDRSGAWRLELPFQPDRELSKNKIKSAHWRTTGPLYKAAKQTAVQALEGLLLPNDEPVYTGPIGLFVDIQWGRRLHAGKTRAQIEQERALDWDGAVSCLAPLFDAMTEVQVWSDDRIVKDSRIIQSVDPTGAGRTVLELWRLGGDDGE